MSNVHQLVSDEVRQRTIRGDPVPTGADQAIAVHIALPQIDVSPDEAIGHCAHLVVASRENGEQPPWLADEDVRRQRGFFQPRPVEPNAGPLERRPHRRRNRSRRVQRDPCVIELVSEERLGIDQQREIRGAEGHKGQSTATEPGTYTSSKIRHVLVIHGVRSRNFEPGGPICRRLSCMQPTGAGRGESRSAILQGTLDLMVLTTLEAMGPMHGYGIARRIEQVSDDALLVNQGTIYLCLIRLVQRRWISAKWGTSENNRKAKFYSITAAGKKQLAQEADNWHRMSGVIARLLRLAQG